MSTDIFVFWEPIVLLLIALASVILTVYDKRAAKTRPQHRVPENVLMLFAVLGGALPMYLTMLLIRHKTKHKKFMVGLPVIIVLQIIAVGIVMYFALR